MIVAHCLSGSFNGFSCDQLVLNVRVPVSETSPLSFAIFVGHFHGSPRLYQLFKIHLWPSSVHLRCNFQMLRLPIDTHFHANCVIIGNDLLL